MRIGSGWRRWRARTPLVPHLRSLGPRAAPELVVLVLHGGRQTSREPVRRHHLAYLRMLAVAASLRRAVRGRSTQIWLLRNRVRGWNEPDLDAVRDARWALAKLRARHPGAGIVLVGHSLGGRVALRLAGADGVRGVCALAPWVTEDDPVGQLRGRSVLIAHGGLDEVTSPAASARYARRARQQPGSPSVTYLRIPGSGHAMLRRWGQWHALIHRFLRALRADERRVAS